MSAYLDTLLPAEKRGTVDRVAVCLARDDEGTADWYATVLFTDEVLYHYRLHTPDEQAPTEKPVLLQNFSSEEMREEVARPGLGKPWLECLSRNGDYWFKVDKEITGYVLSASSVQTPFDLKVKLRLKRAAQAVEAAVEEHKKFVPTESTWGIKP